MRGRAELSIAPPRGLAKFTDTRQSLWLIAPLLLVALTANTSKAGSGAGDVRSQEVHRMPVEVRADVPWDAGCLCGRT
jgi:hypothetical protein